MHPELLTAEHRAPINWFPLQKDNTWVLQLTNTDTRIISCLPVSGLKLLVRGLFQEDIQVRGNSSGVLFGLGTTHNWQALFRFGRPNKLPWRFNLTADRCTAEQAHWLPNNETIVTPAGTFTGCRHLQLAKDNRVKSTCVAEDPSELWFAPNIGPVGLRSAQGDLYLLTSAKIGQQSLPPATNNVVATLAADRNSYLNIGSGLICPPCVTNIPACEIACRIGGPVSATAHLTFVVSNQSTSQVIFTFPTSQQFDIHLIDQSGAIVKAWSDGLAFTNIITTLTMQPGQTNTFTGDMLLTDRHGQQLQGGYVAEAFLTGYGASTVQAMTVISVTLIELGSSTPPATNTVVATLAADQTFYTNHMGGCPSCVTNTPPCEAPCYDPVLTTAHFTFVVINQSTNLVQFTFPTNQQFDINLIDQSGATVKAWSDGQAFADIVTTLTMQPGQTNTFTGDIPLLDRAGKQLDGLYLARAFLTDYGVPAVQATAEISVTLIKP